MAKTEAGLKVRFSTRTEECEGKVVCKDWHATVWMEGTQASPFEIANGDWSSDKEVARTSALCEVVRKLKRTMEQTVVRVVNGHIFLLRPSPVLPDLQGEWQTNWEVYIIKAATRSGSVGGEGHESWLGTLETAWTPDYREIWAFWETKKANHHDSDRKALIAKKEEDETPRLQVVGE